MLTAAIIAKNEEENLPVLLKSLDFCDEIILIDDNSTDKTAKIAESYNAHVYEKSLHNDFAELRNFALSKAKGDWILFVDADEEVSRELAKEIKDAIEVNSFAGYYIKRKDIWWGKEVRFGEAGEIKLLRLIKKGMGEWTGKVHEVLETHGDTDKLKHELFHRPHPTLSQFIADINMYSTIRAEELHEKNVKSSLFQIVSYPVGKFIVNYFFRLGILDGAVGFAYAFLMSFHSYLVRSKLYLLNSKTS